MLITKIPKFKKPSIIIIARMIVLISTTYKVSKKNYYIYVY